jgi:Family of unknown function (DUF5329)
MKPVFGIAPGLEPTACSLTMRVASTPAPVLDLLRREPSILDRVMEESGDCLVLVAAALKHLQTKYGYAKGHVGSAEDFIRLAASRSSMTGEPYLVRCGTSQFLSGDWLTDELRRYRGNTAR